MGEFFLRQSQKRPEYEKRSRALRQGFGEIRFRYLRKTRGQSFSLIVGSEKMSRLVKWRLVNVRKIRSEMGHIECPSHGCIDGAVFAGTMPLRDQPDLLNALGPGLRRKNCIDRVVDCHGQPRRALNSCPGMSSATSVAIRRNASSTNCWCISKPPE